MLIIHTYLSQGLDSSLSSNCTGYRNKQSFTWLLTKIILGETRKSEDHKTPTVILSVRKRFFTGINALFLY